MKPVPEGLIYKETLFLDSGTPSLAMHGGPGAGEPGSL